VNGKRVKGGPNIYGFTVGVLMLDTRFPRIPERNISLISGLIFSQAGRAGLG
jgi:hypothetical protein